MSQQKQATSVIRELVPEACIVGTGDEIMGLAQGSVPPQLTALALQPDFSLQVHNIVVHIPTQCESEFKASLKRFRDAKYKDDSDIDVQVAARRVIVAFHNGWSFTNTRGLANQVPLDEGTVVQ